MAKPDLSQDLQAKARLSIINKNLSLKMTATTAALMLINAMSEIEGWRDINRKTRIMAVLNSPALPYVMEELKRIRKEVEDIY